MEYSLLPWLAVTIYLPHSESLYVQARYREKISCVQLYGNCCSKIHGKEMTRTVQPFWKWQVYQDLYFRQALTLTF